MLGEFENVLSKDKATFPDNPSVWLKDMSSLLNVRLEKVIDEGPVFESKPLGELNWYQEKNDNAMSNLNQGS